MRCVQPASPKLVLVCGMKRKAGAQNPSCGPLGSEDLRRFLKQELKSRGLWREQVRVATIDCLGICSGKGVSVQFPGDERIWIVDAQGEQQAVLDRILALLQPE
ncbi:MAG: putative metal-binding protein [Cognaticolwellia sp.]|jgi:predicted metal-binding protein